MSGSSIPEPIQEHNWAAFGRSALPFLFALMIPVLCFEYLFLGLQPAVFSAVVFVFPLAIGLRMFRSPRKISRRESLYFSVLLIATTLGAVVYAVAMIQMGYHHYAAAQRKVRELSSELRVDRRYQNIEPSVSRKGVRFDGTVGRLRDLKAFQRLVDSQEFPLTVMMNVKVERQP